jgi:XTP/dITP diphosphohydrolase
MTTLVIATRNAHKAQEIRSILGDRFRCLTLRDFPGVPPVTEDADTFAGNAAKKANSLAEWLTRPEISIPGAACEADAPGSRLFALADDSGLEVDALNSAPGVHSARFAALDHPGAPAGNSPDDANNAKLLRLLRDVPLEQRTARFRCALALAEVAACPGGRTFELFEGAVEGRISLGPSGAGGFGYDPLFVPTGYRQSFAELGEEVKNRLSHRARALAKLRAWFETKAA